LRQRQIQTVSFIFAWSLFSMKIVSIILTVLLIIPIALFLSTAGVPLEPGFHTRVFTPHMLPPFILLLTYCAIFLCSIFLSIKKKYISNSILFGFCVLLFIVNSVVHF
jgi:hypothetical protein